MSRSSRILEKISQYIHVLKIDESLACLQLKQLNSLRIFSYLDNVTYLELSEINHISDDLLVIFDNFPLLNYLSVELARLCDFKCLARNRYFVDNVAYDYKSLPLKLPYLKDFSLYCYHRAIRFRQLEPILSNMIYLTKLRFISVSSLFEFELALLSSYGTRISQMLSNIPDLEKLEFQLEFQINKWTCFTSSYRLLTEQSFININKWNIVFNFDEERNHYSIFTLPAMSDASYHFHSLSPTLLYNHDYSSIRKIGIFESFSQPILFTELAKFLTENFSKLTSLTISNQMNNVGKSETSSESKLRLNHLKYLEIKENISCLDQLLLLAPNLTSLVINDIQCLQNIRVKNNIKYLGLSDCNHLPKVRTTSFQNIQTLEIVFKSVESIISWINDKEISMFCEMINNMTNLVSLRILISPVNENVDHITNIMYETLKITNMADDESEKNPKKRRTVLDTTQSSSISKQIMIKKPPDETTNT
ncbi:unnamed protein product [Didymodactylos carnosus]|uniref:Uncharacterized protein n=1 Tax=Didymodactylos carnosus TaxID=1234261 RepID=A0A814B0D8_9BILA|nr:unnamed protein product [Didymodactylos carnosus]CAF3700336.1 unnamed protein product [Didymodactylos carnosus]